VILEPILPAVPPATSYTCRIVATVLGGDTYEQILKLQPIRFLGFELDPLVHEAADGYITGNFQLDGPAPPGGVLVRFAPNDRETQIVRMSSGGRTIEAGDNGFQLISEDNIWIPAGSSNALVTWMAPPRVAQRTRPFDAGVFRPGGFEYERVFVDIQPATSFGPIQIELSTDRVIHDEEIQVTITLPRPAPEPGLSLRLENQADPDVEPPLLGVDTLPHRSSLFVPPGETTVIYTFKAFHTGAHFRTLTLQAGLAFQQDK